METPPVLADPVFALMLAYAPASARPALTALSALDRRLGAIHAAARDPAIGLMRLIWWRDALLALDHGPPPAEPLLRDVARLLLPVPASGKDLATLAEGWGALLEGEPDAGALAVHARDRGSRLFVLAARVLGMPEAADVGRAGELWALIDLRGRLAVADATLLTLARARLGQGRGERWPRALRPLGMLASLAVADARGRSDGAIRRLLRMIAHRVTGRTGLGGPPPPP